MIDPGSIHSVRQNGLGWQIVQRGEVVESTVYPTREQACERARYLNGVEERFEDTLARLTHMIYWLVREHGIARSDAENLLQRGLARIRRGDHEDLAIFSVGGAARAARR